MFINKCTVSDHHIPGIVLDAEKEMTKADKGPVTIKLTTDWGKPGIEQISN